MSRLHLSRRVGVSVLAAVLVVAVVVAIVGVGLVRRSFPQTSGQLTVPGLTSTVSVLRDGQGVPQIYADNAKDLFQAQGYVAAQDRFFEMDLRRHITAGRLAELVGPDAVATDKVIRTMGWRSVAEAELPTLAPETRQYLQAYADGVNAWIKAAGSPSRMALEYAVLSRKAPDYHVEPWTPVDSLAWLKAMAWDLRGNYDDELTRARLAGTMSPAHLDELYPPYPLADHQPILSQKDWNPWQSSTGAAGAIAAAVAGTSAAARASASAAAAAKGRTSAAKVSAPAGALGSQPARAAYARVASALATVPATLGRGEGIGSNSWVVGSAHSTTGKPLLANDPHLAVGIPGIWYQTGLHCRTVDARCPFDVSGFSFAGLPGIVIGHNQSIAWGFTNLGPDVTDFYLEQIEGDTYLRDGKYIPLPTHQETIKVAGAADVTITVRRTVHGPVLSDVLPDVAEAGRSAPVNGKEGTGSYAVSLAWTGLLSDHTADALFGMDTAQTFAQFRNASKDFAAPAQNLVYADVNGHIGYQAPGRIPIRASATRGAPPGYWPAPGWDSSFDWKGFVPFASMPYSYDPPEGMVVTANQAVTAYFTPFLTTEWDPGFRSQRISDLLKGSAKVSPQRMSQIQGDTRNGFAPALVKLLLAVNLDKDPFTRQAQDLLRHWDFTTPTGRSPDGAAAAYYNAVWRQLLTLTFNDELPQDLNADGGARWREVVSRLLTHPSDSWWDNRQTPGLIEGRDEILRESLVDARLELTRELGKNPGTWQWGRMHQLELRHQVLGGDGVPGVVRALFNRGSWDMPGGSAIVDANGWNAAKGYDVNKGPSMRMVVDLADLDASRWVNQTGESGHPFSGHYDDQIDAWIHNQSYPWPFTEKAVRAASADELTLRPGTDGG